MAAPIAHIFLALLALPKYFPDKNVKEFIVGTIFPDIRYIAAIERSNTHYKNITIEAIQKETSSFKAGILFHSLVDETRDRYLIEQGVYDIIPDTRYANMALKYFEDTILYDKTKNWDTIKHYFDTILWEETIFCISEDTIKKWHKLIKLYISKRVTPQNSLTLYLTLKYTPIPRVIIQLFISIIIKLHILPKKLKEVTFTVKQCTKNKKLKHIVLSFYDNFEYIITQKNSPAYMYA